MISDEAVLKQVSAILCEEFELKPEQIQPEATIFDDLGLDSLDAIDMVVILEKSLGIKLANQEILKEIRTVDDLHKIVIQLQTEQPSAGN